MEPEQNQKPNIPEEKKVPETQERIPIKSLRTFQGDVQEAISKNKYSSTTILVSEQKRKLERPELETLSRTSKSRNKNFIFYGTVFIFLGLFAVTSIYYIKSSEKTVIEKTTKTLLTFSKEKKVSLINISREELVTKFAEERNAFSAPVNSILYLNLLSKDKEVKTVDLLSIFSPKMLPSLVRSFGEKYMVGVYSFDTNEPFIILTVDDFSLSYSGMLKWENDIASDLGPFFEIPALDASSTPRVFTDLSVKNKDIRIMKDSTGKSLILYSFIDRKTLVIAKTENVLTAIFAKFLINQQVK